MSVANDERILAKNYGLPTLSRGPVFRDVLNQNNCRLSHPVLPETHINININPQGQILVNAKEQTQKVFAPVIVCAC